MSSCVMTKKQPSQIKVIALFLGGGGGGLCFTGFGHMAVFIPIP